MHNHSIFFPVSFISLILFPFTAMLPQEMAPLRFALTADFYGDEMHYNEGEPFRQYLIKCIKQNRLAEVEQALLNGFNVDTICKYGSYGPFTTLLCEAISNGLADMIQLLIKHNADVQLSAEKLVGLTPLHIAILKATDSTIVQILLKKNANPNAPDNLDRTPLYHAVSQSLIPTKNYITDVIQALLDHGGSISIKSQLNETPLSLAQRITTTDCHNTLAQRVLTLLQEHERWSPARRAWIAVIVRHANHSALSVNPKTGIGAFMPTATLPSASSGGVDGDPDEADNDLPPLEYVSSDDD
jgi:hypothetical protein